MVRREPTGSSPRARGSRSLIVFTLSPVRFVVSAGARLRRPGRVFIHGELVSPTDPAYGGVAAAAAGRRGWTSKCGRFRGRSGVDIADVIGHRRRRMQLGACCQVHPRAGGEHRCWPSTTHGSSPRARGSPSRLELDRGAGAPRSSPRLELGTLTEITLLCAERPKVQKTGSAWMHLATLYRSLSLPQPSPATSSSRAIRTRPARPPGACWPGSGGGARIAAAARSLRARPRPWRPSSRRPADRVVGLSAQAISERFAAAARAAGPGSGSRPARSVGRPA